jgi:hypothetical protein
MPEHETRRSPSRTLRHPFIECGSFHYPYNPRSRGPAPVSGPGGSAGTRIATALWVRSGIKKLDLALPGVPTRC